MNFISRSTLLLALAALPAANPASAENPFTNTPPAIVRPAGPGIFEIGLARVDAFKREISFPAEVHMRQGQVEYLVVSAIGKLHESVLKTRAEPFHIHTAALLLIGADETNHPPDVAIEVEIEGEATPAAGLIRNTETSAPMNQPILRYQGSRTSEGVFLAQRDGSIVALIEDPDALVDNPGPDRKKDEIWEPFTAKLPPVGQPVRITLKFTQEKKK